MDENKKYFDFRSDYLFELGFIFNPLPQIDGSGNGFFMAACLIGTAAGIVKTIVGMPAAGRRLRITNSKHIHVLYMFALITVQQPAKN